MYPRFTSPRGLSGFLMGELGAGHAVLLCADVRAAAEFYARTLGFGISDYVVSPDGGAVGAFLHCNPRHHSLAFFAVPMSQRGKKMQHLMIETNSLDDVGLSYDLCLDHKITKSSLGRHPDDRGLSFYFRNPSGWLFEYAWQLRTIDPDNFATEKYKMGAGNGWGHAGLFSPEE
jgi:2,3-dihydroxybiphenyl 1,2-dioxygenase